ncbi:glycosyltransferase [Oceanihabitans sediminis]|uniref:glycosyltransferase family 2 protein n=1 Tax=Oceanihabitans sediminis TaxID=1812012 RepID=UPI00299D429F|nr:glycosyltransferase [Oceanihabitans sediminis]MDX1774893.1 glycosyltransferase [Oceanihabitans sediminis]
MVEKPMVSVCMITYGHEKYIEEAITNVLNQEVDFEFELVVANDCSPDNTDTIIKNIIDTHQKGELINYYSHKKNMGMMPNFVFALKKCKGKYIALCEGDDYWTDTLKLQKQVGFLEMNLDYNISFHPIKIFNENSQELQVDSITREVPNVTDILDLAKGNYIHTASVVLRNNFKLKKWFLKVYIGDWALYMLAVKNNKVAKLEGTMAVYRVHDLSVWSSKSEQKRIEQTNKTVLIILKNLKGINEAAKSILKSRLTSKNILSFKMILKNIYNRIR